MPFPELHGESTEYVGRAEDAIIATSNYRLHIKFKESVVNVSIFEKRPMTLEVWCDERTFPTQLKVTKEWILMSLLESVWRCVVMFCEWAELGGGGHCASAAVTGPFRADLRWQAAPHDFSSPLFSTRACLRPPLCLCTCRCRGCSGSRGDAEQSRPLSLRLLSPR